MQASGCVHIQNSAVAMSFVVQKTKKCFSSIGLDHDREPANAGVKGERVL